VLARVLGDPSLSRARVPLVALMRLDQSSSHPLMPCAPLILQAERGYSVVETRYAQENGLRILRNFPQGFCDLLGFSVLLEPPMQVNCSFVLGGFKGLVAHKAD
jgi:hypothetical protein